MHRGRELKTSSKILSTTTEETFEEEEVFKTEEEGTLKMDNSTIKLYNNTLHQRQIPLVVDNKSPEICRTPRGSSKWQLKDLSRRALLKTTDTPLTKKAIEPMEKAQGYIYSGIGLDRNRSSPSFSKSACTENFQQQENSRIRKHLSLARSQKNGGLWSSSAFERASSNIFSHSCSAKEKREVPISYRHEISKFTSDSPEVQDGGSRDVIEDARTRRQHVYCRSSRWLLPHQHARIGNSMARFSMGRKILCLQSTPLWSVNISPRILEDNAQHRIAFKTTRTSSLSLPRRLHRFNKKQLDDTTKEISQTTTRSRITHLAGKVKFKSRTREGVFRSVSEDERKTNVSCPKSEKVGCDERDLKITSKKKRTSTSSKSSESSWSMHFPIKSSRTHKVANEELIQRPQQESSLGSKSVSIERSCSRSDMVERYNGKLG